MHNTAKTMVLIPGAVKIGMLVRKRMRLHRTHNTAQDDDDDCCGVSNDGDEEEEDARACNAAMKWTDCLRRGGGRHVERGIEGGV